MTKEKDGYAWQDGYWSKSSGVPHNHKLDFFCNLCKVPTGTIDNKFLLTLGICSSCYVRFVESRPKPNIDLSKYAKVKLEGLDLSNKEFLKKLEKE